MTFEPCRPATIKLLPYGRAPFREPPLASELKKKDICFRRCLSFWRSRRDSNSRAALTATRFPVVLVMTTSILLHIRLSHPWSLHKRRVLLYQFFAARQEENTKKTKKPDETEKDGKYYSLSQQRERVTIRLQKAGRR